MVKTLKYSDIVRGGTVDYAKVGKVSSTSVQKHTKKDWKTWVQLLEKAGAHNWTYQQIVAYLQKKYKLSPWWQQGVALGFEIATGRRKVGQDAKGKYMVTATKTLAVEAKAVWKKLVSAEGQKIWLCPFSPIRITPKTPFETKDGFFGEIRTMALNRKVRMFWQDPQWEKPTVVEIFIVSRPAKKCILVFNHTGIPDDKTRRLMKDRWRTAADSLFS